MKMKKLIGSLIATVMAMGMAGGTSTNAERMLITQTIATNDINTIETTEAIKPSTIWRESYEYTTTNSNNNNVGTYQCTFVAESDGHIRIDLYCLKGGKINVIGKIAYNDSMISSIGDDNSKFNNYGYGTKNVIAYDGDNIVYTTMYGDTTYSGNLYATYDLYVKEPYLATEQTLYIWDTAFTIPFGEPAVDYQSQIDNLTAEIETLKEENGRLLNTLASQKNRAYGDMNDDGSVDARDASLLLTLYARQSVGDPITLDKLIEEQKGQ